MEKKIKKIESKSDTNVVRALPKVSIRGRKFEGYVIKKFDKRIVIEYEKVKYLRKYERYIKNKSKIHARLPEHLKDQIKIGDYIQIQECRPLSKLIHSIVIKKIRDGKIK